MARPHDSLLMKQTEASSLPGSCDSVCHLSPNQNCYVIYNFNFLTPPNKR